MIGYGCLACGQQAELAEAIPHLDTCELYGKIRGRYVHNEGLPPITVETRESHKGEFDFWFTRLLMMENSSCLERDVLRNQRKNLFEEWLRVRPFLTKEEADLLNKRKNNGEKAIESDGT